MDLGRYSNLTAQSLNEKFVLNGADVIIQEETITVYSTVEKEEKFTLDSGGNAKLFPVQILLA